MRFEFFANSPSSSSVILEKFRSIRYLGIGTTSSRAGYRLVLRLARDGGRLGASEGTRLLPSWPVKGRRVSRSEGRGRGSAGSRSTSRPCGSPGTSVSSGPGLLITSAGSQFTLVAVFVQVKELTGSTAAVGATGLAYVAGLVAGALAGGAVLDAGIAAGS